VIATVNAMIRQKAVKSLALTPVFFLLSMKKSHYLKRRGRRDAP
jgi:hypothetical protein